MYAFHKTLIRYALSLWLIIAVYLISGCAVLTENQIKAVNQFAKATENYGTTPSAAIKAWAELQITASAAEVTTMQSEQSMWNHIESSFDTYERIIDRSERATKSFEVLELYSKLLKQLTAANYTEALDAKSKDLGEALDSAMEFYNSRFGASISTFGGVAAGIIRGAGGLYIRAKQSEALKRVVKDADPAINELTSAIIKTATAVELGTDKELDTLEEEIKAALKYAPTIKVDSSERKIIPNLASYVRTVELLQRGRKAIQIVGSAKAAALKYREAHHQLVKNTRNKVDDVDELIQIIKALKEEIDAGIKIKKSIGD